MGQGALSKPAVQWWLSLNSSTIAQTLDPTFPTIKMGKLAGLKMLNDKKLAVQAKKMQEKKQTGRLAIKKWTTGVHRVIRRREDCRQHRTKR